MLERVLAVGMAMGCVGEGIAVGTVMGCIGQDISCGCSDGVCWRVY